MKTERTKIINFNYPNPNSLPAVRRPNFKFQVNYSWPMVHPQTMKIIDGKNVIPAPYQVRGKLQRESSFFMKI